MAHTNKITDVPNVVIKTGKMFTQWPLKAKVGAIIVGLILYIYFILFLKGVYLKTKKLDHLTEMVALTQRLVEEVQTSDKLMETRLHDLSNY